MFENQDLVVELNETVIDGQLTQSRDLPDLLDLRHSFLDSEHLHLDGLHRLVDCGELGRRFCERLEKSLHLRTDLRASQTKLNVQILGIGGELVHTVW